LGDINYMAVATDSDDNGIGQIVTCEMLAQEEKNRQVAAAILTGVAGAANAYSASRAGYGTYTTPNGRTGTFYL